MGDLIRREKVTSGLTQILLNVHKKTKLCTTITIKLVSHNTFATSATVV